MLHRNLIVLPPYILLSLPAQLLKLPFVAQLLLWYRNSTGLVVSMEKAGKKENKSHASRVKKFYSSNLSKVLSFSKEVRLIFVNFVSHRLGLYHRNIHGFFTLWRMSPMVFRSELKLRQMLMIVFWLESDRLTRCLTTGLQTGVLSA